LRRSENGLPGGFKHVVDEHNHRLTLDNGLAGFADLVVLNVRGGGLFLVVQVGVADLQPSFQGNKLVLKSVRQFVRQHRTLLLNVDPIEQVNGFSLRVVIPGYLFTQQGHEKRLQIEVSRQKSELFQHQLGTAQPLRVLVLSHIFFEIGHNFVATGEASLDLFLDG
jgi:hypothetical protein